MAIATNINPLRKGRGFSRIREILGDHFFLLPLTNAWQYRELIRALLRRDLAERFRDTCIGWIWAVLAPLVMLGVYLLVFTNVVTVPTSSDASTGNRALSMFVGLIIFNLFAELISRAPTLLHEHVHFIKKSIFPSEALAWIAMLRAMTYAGIGLAVLLVAQIVLTSSVPLSALLFPIVAIPFCLMTMGAIWFLAALGALTRDVSHLMITIVPVLMFASPVFYSVVDLPPNLQLLSYFNPLTGPIEMARQTLLAGRAPNLVMYGISSTASLVIFYAGYAFFTRYRDVVVDVI